MPRSSLALCLPAACPLKSTPLSGPQPTPTPEQAHRFLGGTHLVRERVGCAMAGLLPTLNATRPAWTRTCLPLARPPSATSSPTRPNSTPPSPNRIQNPKGKGYQRHLGSYATAADAAVRACGGQGGLTLTLSLTLHRHPLAGSPPAKPRPPTTHPHTHAAALLRPRLPQAAGRGGHPELCARRVRAGGWVGGWTVGGGRGVAVGAGVGSASPACAASRVPAACPPRGLAPQNPPHPHSHAHPRRTLSCWSTIAPTSCE